MSSPETPLSGPASSRPASWRTGQPASTEHRPTYRWQQTPAEAAATQRARRRHLRHAVWLVLGAALIGALVYFLLYAPRRTPLLAVVAAGDSLDLPPNAGVQEDLAALRHLDRRTLSVFGGVDDWPSAERGLHHFDQHLRRISKTRRKTDPLIIYLSLPGAVDGAGRPCLIPPGAAPEQEETWLPLSRLLLRLKDPALRLSQVKKLLVLDCNRLRVHWRAGILENTFADRLASALTEAEVPNLVVLNSAAPGEVGWAAPEVNGSVFGQCLALGLAGEADGVRSADGRNGRVSLHELVAYLQHRVDGWARQNREESQRPLLLPEHAGDFDLTWVLQRRALRDFQQWAGRRRPDASSWEQELATLWRRHDELLDGAPYRSAPLAWRDFQHRLLWLEQAAIAGGAYHSAARRIANELSQLVERGPQAFAAPGAREPLEFPVTTLPLAEYLGTIDAPTAGQVREALTGWEKSPDAAGLTAALQAWPAGAVPEALAERHFLRLLQRYEVPASEIGAEPLHRAWQLMQHAEQLAVPADLRTHYWLRATLVAGDSARHQATDCLLAGAQPVLLEYERWAGDAERHYTAAAEIEREVAEAVCVRDQTLAELPYLARWLTASPHRNGLEQNADAVTKLRAMIEHTRRLGEQIAQHRSDPGAESSASPTFLGLRDQVQAQWAEVKQLYADRCRQLEATREPTPAAVVQVLEVLQAPLLPARQRSNLRERLTAWSEKLHQRATIASGSPSEPPLTPTPAHREWLVGLGSAHPAVAILQPPGEPAAGPDETPAPTTPQDLLAALETQGQRVRRLLAEIPAQVLRSGAESLTVGDDPPPPRGAEHLPARLPLSRSEETVRAAAAIGFPELADDPIARLHRFDLQQLLTWHAGRTLDAFWGPAVAGEPSFFDRAATAALRNAEQVFPQHPGATRQWQRLRGLLERRQLAARSGLAIAATDFLLIEDPAPGTGTVRVTRQAAGQDDAIPQGLLGLALRDHRGRLPEASRLLATAALTTEGQSLAYALPAAALAQRGPQLQAVALLRGHEFTAPSLLRMLGGVRIEFARHPAVDPQVTLYGARRKQPSLMFVLDCSHSMETPMTLEVPNGAPAVPTTRLDVAKGALQTMLERLAQRPEQRVGVRFYGHRVGWNLKQASEVLVQKDYPRPVATDLSPSEDVELVLPLGRFDQLAAGTVTRLLRKVTPWGETPLYLALVQAVQDFTLDRPDTEKSMVVITDGINNQFNPQPEAAKSLRDVLTARGGRPIRIHIVGFGIPENEREQAVREFHELAVATDGSYHLATGVDSLLRRLEELLGFGEYSVVAASGELVGRRVVDQPVPVAPLPQPGDYRVQWQSLEEPIRLEGGEALELEIDAPTRGLLSLRYERGAPVFRPLVSGTPPAPTGVNFCVHQPLAKARQVRFHFSFQRADRHFTARPAEVWIEVTPQHRRGLRSYPKYIFYDVNYEPRTRVPVLEWTAAQWPDEAEQAEVRVWGRMTKIPPTVVVALADVADRVPEHGEGHPLSAVPGVTYQVRTQRGAARDEALYRVSLLERHGAGSTGVDALKVELVPAAQRIRHQFDAENRLVLHTFDYHLPEGEIPENLAIHFTTRAALQSEAWLPDEPAVVGVAAQDDLLPLTAPSSSGRATSSP